MRNPVVSQQGPSGADRSAAAELVCLRLGAVTERLRIPGRLTGLSDLRTLI